VQEEDDRERAERETSARRVLTQSGAGELPRPPWLHPSQPPSSTDLVHFAVWREGTSEDDVLAALTLLPAMRAEVEQLETALVFTARARGLSWGRIARAMGLGSAQAALQRFERLNRRTEPRQRT
jgi:hypothetical protein